MSAVLSQGGAASSAIAAIDLEQVQLFRGLHAAEVAVLEPLCRPIECAAGDAIFRLGAPAHDLFVVSAGQVALTLPVPIGGAYREVRVHEVDAGLVIGWSALVPPNKYTFGAQAVSAARLLALSAAALEQVFSAYPRIQRTVFTNLTGVIASRLTQLQAIVLRDLQRRLTERIAS